MHSALASVRGPCVPVLQACACARAHEPRPLRACPPAAAENAHALLTPGLMTVDVLCSAVDTWTENALIQARARTVLRRLGAHVHYHVRLVATPAAIAATP